MWKRRRGNLCVRRYFASLWAGLCVSAALCAAASEESALREALTIVQILRSEYGRIMRSSTDTPAPTCAATTTVPNSNLSSDSVPSRRLWTSSWNNEAVRGRRMDYDDAFGAHPNDTAQPLEAPSSTANLRPSPNELIEDATKPSIPVSDTTELTSSRTLLPSSSTLVQSDPSRVPLSMDFQSSETEPAPKTMLTTILQTTIKHASASTLANPQSNTSGSSQLLKKLKGTKKITNTPAPEVQQVASELANELKAGDRPRPSRLNRPPARATWREYLPHSTRYAVPLPENHAFCYTDPGNALCRTLI